MPVTEESRKRKNGPGKRGPSTVSKAEQIRISTGHRIAVNLDPEHGRPIDKGVSSLLSNECGKIVREKCPMVFESWTKITRDVKRNLTKEVEDKMILKEEAYLQELVGKHPSVPIKELPITPEVGIEILKDVLSVKPKQPVRGLGTFWVNENPTSSIIEELEEVYAVLERERAIRTKIQGMLDAAYERLGRLDPDFEPPQLHLVEC